MNLGSEIAVREWLLTRGFYCRMVRVLVTMKDQVFDSQWLIFLGHYFMKKGFILLISLRYALMHRSYSLL